MGRYPKILAIDKDYELHIHSLKIRHKVKQIAKQIDKDFKDKEPPILIGILDGSFVFLADLVREMKINCEVDFIRVSSYKDGQVSGELKMLGYLKNSIRNRHVIIVEDIVDTGKTIRFVYKYLQKKKPKSINLTCILRKKSFPYSIQYYGFKCDDRFVVGYGLDNARLGRNLKSIYIHKLPQTEKS